VGQCETKERDFKQDFKSKVLRAAMSKTLKNKERKEAMRVGFLHPSTQHT
jgi:hypothetical protein